MRSPTTYGLAVLLLASLAFNVRLWLARDDRARAPKGAVVVAPPRVDATTCERRLQACEQTSWEMARRVIAADHAPGSTDPAGGAAKGPEHPTEAAALCAKAEQNLRETWQRDRDKIAWSLTQSLADKDEQERNVVKEAARMREVAGLDDREAAEVARAYREKRLARVADAQAALGREPQDFAAMLDSARGLFADEDALLESVSGPAARDAWRAEQLEGRTVLLALVATMADRDWDESIHW